MVEPNYLYIGSAKSASSWIWKLLAEHPEAYASPAKEIHFFDRYYDKGWDWYCSHFKPESGQTVIGEVCHDYFLDVEYAKRIQKHLPEVRLLCCLREPVDLLHSLYRYDRRVFRLFTSRDYESGIGFHEFIEDERVLAYVSFVQNLRPFYELFPAENIKIFFFEDLKRSATGFSEELFHFLGISPILDLPVINTVVNPALEARSKFMAEIAQRIVQLLRNMGFTELVGCLTGNRFLEQLFFRKPVEKKARQEDLDDPFVAGVARELHRDNEELEKMAGRPLPREWLRVSRR